MKTNLPGIRKIAYVETSLLPADITLRALANAPVGIYTTVNFLYIVGKATCETETDFDNNSSIEKATLKFQTSDVVPTEKHLAFIIYTTNGDTYVIGAKEQPYPIVKIENTTGTPDGEANIKRYTVSFSARHSLVSCAV